MSLRGVHRASLFGGNISSSAGPQGHGAEDPDWGGGPQGVPQGMGKGDSAILQVPRGLALVSCHRGWLSHEAMLLHGPSPDLFFRGTTGPHPPRELNVPAPCFPSEGPLTPRETFRRLALAAGASVPGAGVPDTAVWRPWLAQGTEAQPLA